jgi:hypothetical protein
VKLTGEHNRRMLIEHINGEREKWLASTFSHIEGKLLISVFLNLLLSQLQG